MKQLIIKPEVCYGCRTCELVCSFGHYGQFNPKMANCKVFEYDQASVAIPSVCLQCEDAACMKICPVKAISRDENGAYVMDYNRCIGCKMCMNACPLGNISFHPSIRKVFKCDLCGGDPKCAKFCPSGAISFVDTDAESDRRAALSETYKELIGEEA